MTSVTISGPDDRREHDDRDDQDDHQFSAFHCTLSLLAMRSWSRSASIWAAVCAPPSVTICSITRRRDSKRSMCWAYCALFSAARLLWLVICFSLMRSHILNGTMRIAVTGISTQIQLDGSSHIRLPFLLSDYLGCCGVRSSRGRVDWPGNLAAAS